MKIKINNIICGILLLVGFLSTAIYTTAITQRIPVENTQPKQQQQQNVKPANVIQPQKEVTPVPNNEEKPAVNEVEDANSDSQNNEKPVSDVINIEPQKTYSQINITSTTEISKTNPKINLSLRNSDVQQVLRMFADKAGLNIIFHKSAKGSVTMDLVNVPINDAFKYVVQITGLSYYIEDKTIFVYSAASPMPAGRNMLTTIPVKYIEASAIANFLNKNIFANNSSGLSNSDIVVTNPVSNELLVFGTQSDILMVEKIVEKFDVRPMSTTFTVSNTSPKEMAALLCNSFLLTSPDTLVNPRNSWQASNLGSAGNVVACIVKNQVQSTQFSSMNMHNMIITYFPQRGTINVLGGSEQQLEFIREFIKNNDAQTPQAYLEIVLLELNNKGRESFVETLNVYSKYFSATKETCKQLHSKTYPVFITKESDPSGDVSFATWLTNYLVNNKKAKLIANPRIVANNAKTAIIDMTSDYIKTKTQNGYEIGKDNGLKMEIVPLISSEGYITLDIKPQYSTEKMIVKTSKDKKSSATLLQRRGTELKNIRVKDGQTLILSGFTKDYLNVDKKVLKDKKSTQQSELVILITPRLIDMETDETTK